MESGPFRVLRAHANAIIGSPQFGMPALRSRDGTVLEQRVAIECDGLGTFWSSKGRTPAQRCASSPTAMTGFATSVCRIRPRRTHVGAFTLCFVPSASAPFQILEIGRAHA